MKRSQVERVEARLITLPCTPRGPLAGLAERASSPRRTRAPLPGARSQEVSPSQAHQLSRRASASRPGGHVRASWLGTESAREMYV